MPELAEASNDLERTTQLAEGLVAEVERLRAAEVKLKAAAASAEVKARRYQAELLLVFDELERLDPKRVTNL